MNIYKDPNTNDTRLAHESPEGWVEIDQQELDVIRESRRIQPDPKDAIRAAIAVLESTVTPRRLREALLFGDYSFIVKVNQDIDALRKTL